MGCRQSLIGGRYALFDVATRSLSPDYYSTLLWRRLMSPKVLRSGISGHELCDALCASGRKPPDPALRAYVHCA